MEYLSTRDGESCAEWIERKSIINANFIDVYYLNSPIHVINFSLIVARFLGFKERTLKIRFDLSFRAIKRFLKKKDTSEYMYIHIYLLN